MQNSHASHPIAAAIAIAIEIAQQNLGSAALATTTRSHTTKKAALTPGCLSSAK